MFFWAEKEIRGLGYKTQVIPELQKILMRSDYSNTAAMTENLVLVG